MCGIAGYSGSFDKRLLNRMNVRIAHRGPDGAGVWTDDNAGVGLAHRRLAIIDLTDTGAQPMASPDNLVQIVFNGEIYNYRELRVELQAKGFVFHGYSDTEVLLNAYLAYGHDCLDRLNGMFAFAVWDARTKETFLARDLFGIKPLYWARAPEGILYASELKALLVHPGVARSIDPVAVQAYLTFLWAPGVLTMLQDVRKLQPGHAMILAGGQVRRLWQYADSPTSPEAFESLAPDEWIEYVRHTLRASVRRQLVADVDVGAFLSGGIDSSTLVALAVQERDPAKFRCYTIDLAKQTETEGLADDLPYARRAADYFGVPLREIAVTADVVDGISDLVWALDEPQADPAPLNVSFICRAARSDGLKVLLSGAGGDDIFSGYRRHVAVNYEHWWTWLPRSVRARLSGAVSGLPVNMPRVRRLRKLLATAHLDRDRRLVAWFDWADDTIRAQVLHPDLRQTAGDPYAALLQPLSSYRGNPHPLSRLLYLESKGFLPDHNLNYTDKMSMLHGVEVRVPFLDLELTKLAARIPPNLKQRGLVSKYILKQAVRGLLPAEIINRPKSGFGMPIRQWLCGPLNSMVRDRLTSTSFRSRGWFDANGVSRLLDDNAAGRVDASYVIWSLLTLDYWAERFLEPA